MLAVTRAEVAIAGDSILYSIHRAALQFSAANPNPQVSFLDPLPGRVNSYTTADEKNWATGSQHYGTAHVTGVWQGVDARYTMNPAAGLTLRLVFRPGVDPAIAQFEFTNIYSMELLAEGSLRVKFGGSKVDPALMFRAPEAWQESGSGRATLGVQFNVQSAAKFSFRVEAYDTTLPLAIELPLPFPTTHMPQEPRPFFRDAAGNVFVVDILADAPGKDLAPGQEACGSSILRPIPCTDVVVSKHRPDGQLAFMTYLSGARREVGRFVGLGAGGAVVVAGNTESPDFPATRGSYQAEYGGPAPGTGLCCCRRLFRRRLNPETGVLLTGTFVGGPHRDEMGEGALGTDGSLYFLPGTRPTFSAGMPVSPGALQPQCLGDPCGNGYAARISPNLDRMLYGTYLPGRAQANAHGSASPPAVRTRSLPGSTQRAAAWFSPRMWELRTTTRFTG